MRTVEQFINEECGGNKAAFARRAGVLPQQVTKWVRPGAFIVTSEGFIIPARTVKIGDISQTGGSHDQTE